MFMDIRFKRLGLVFALAALGLSGCDLPFGDGNIPRTDISGRQEEDKENTLAEGVIRLVSAADVSDYIKLGEYKSLILQNQEVTDEQVEERIESMLADDSSQVRGADSAVRAGDTVVINYVGTIGFDTFDGSIGNNYSLLVGSGEMVEGFEDALIGMTVGETRSFTISYPEDDPREELRGVSADYRVTLQSCARPADLTEEWAAKQGYDSIAAMRLAVREELEQAAREPDQRRAQVWRQILDSCEVTEYPQEDMDRAEEEYKTLLERYAAQAELDLDDFLLSQGKTQEDYLEDSLAYAKAKVKQNLIITGIMDAENMTLEDAESTRILADLVSQFKAEDANELIDSYGKQEVYESVGLVRVMDYVSEQTPNEDSEG